MEVGEIVSCVVVDEKSVMCNNVTFTESEGLLKASNALFWVYLMVYIVLVLFAGTLCVEACKASSRPYQVAPLAVQARSIAIARSF